MDNNMHGNLNSLQFILNSQMSPIVASSTRHESDEVGIDERVAF